MSFQAASDLVIEHGESSRSRRLRRNRLRIALAVAAVEGILVLAGRIPWWVVLPLAFAAIVLYVFVRNEARGELVQVAWIAAFSQVALVLVPIAAALFAALAVVTVAMFAVIVLYALVRDRG
jgi:hypothetical protein